MKSNARKLVVIGSLGLIVASLIAFAATGMYPYTRFRDKDIERVNAQQDLADLFAEATEEPAAPAKVESVNAIGLLPSGPGLASISVLTVSGPAVLAIGAVVWVSRRAARTHAASIAPGTPVRPGSERA